MRNNSILAIVPSSGEGKRANFKKFSTIPKQYILINGRSIIFFSIIQLVKSIKIKKILITVKIDDKYIKYLSIVSKKIRILNVGKNTRSLTIIETLKYNNTKNFSWLLIQDSVRPALSIKNLNKLISKCNLKNKFLTLAYPISDTVKKISEHTISTICRKKLWLIQTPQIMKIGIIKKLIKSSLKLNVKFTDESSLFEYFGIKPVIIRSNINNFKVTWPEEFNIIKNCLKCIQ